MIYWYRMSFQRDYIFMSEKQGKTLKKKKKGAV